MVTKYKAGHIARPGPWMHVSSILTDAGAQVLQEADITWRRRTVRARLDAELLDTGSQILLGDGGLAEGTALRHAARGRRRCDANGFIGPNVLQPGKEALRGHEVGGDAEPQGVQ